MKPVFFLLFLATEFVILITLNIYAANLPESKFHQQTLKSEITRKLMLTDLSLWTEARYTRHPSQADYFTPFQDFPAAVEHFPAGSIVRLPDHLLSVPLTTAPSVAK